MSDSSKLKWWIYFKKNIDKYCTTIVSFWKQQNKLKCV